MFGIVKVALWVNASHFNVDSLQVLLHLHEVAVTQVHTIHHVFHVSFMSYLLLGESLLLNFCLQRIVGFVWHTRNEFVYFTVKIFGRLPRGA